MPSVLSELVIMIMGNSQINTINNPTNNIPTIEKSKPDFSIILFFQFYVNLYTLFASFLVYKYTPATPEKRELLSCLS